MATPQTSLRLPPDRTRSSLIYGIMLVWGLLSGIAAVWLLAEFGFSTSDTKFYLLPWCLATGLVVSAPSAYYIYKKTFDPFHPLVFAAWSYFFPGFFIGGLILAAGFSQPSFLAYIQDESYNLPLTFAYIILGYAGLTAGFMVPQAARAGRWLGNKLPEWQMTDTEVPLPGLILLSLGVAMILLSFVQGLFGFQRAEELPIYNGILYLVTLFWIQASFMLWVYVFRAKQISIPQLLVIAALVVTTLLRSAFLGNRGGLTQAAIVIAFGYVFAGRKLTSRHYAAGSIILALALLIGMTWGTTFRTIKGSQEQVSPGEYAEMVGRTFDKMSREDLSTAFGKGLSALAERLDSVSTLAVVVSNYEQLAPYEEQWGINNNIYLETVTFAVPRILWPDKPVALDPLRYSDLYFNYGENAFLMTPIGDLLRNFGPFGVPLGMVALGLLLRFIYAALIEGRPFSYWRAVMFFMLLTNISYEGTYGSILPTVCKVGFIAIVGILIVRLVVLAFRTAPLRALR
jgi:hypothetical protein